MENDQQRNPDYQRNRRVAGQPRTPAGVGDHREVAGGLVEHQRVGRVSRRLKRLTGRVGHQLVVGRTRDQGHLFVDADLRMVVVDERLVGRLIVHANRADPWKAMKLSREFEPETARRQQVVVPILDRISPGQLADTPLHAIRRHHDIIDLAQHLIKLFGHVLRRPVPVEVDRHRPILKIPNGQTRPERDRQRIVPGLDAEDAPIRHVVVDPTRGLEPRVGSRVDRGERRGPKHDAEQRGAHHRPPRPRTHHPRRPAPERIQRQRTGDRECRQQRRRIAQELRFRQDHDQPLNHEPSDDHDAGRLRAADRSFAKRDNANQAEQPGDGSKSPAHQLLYLIDTGKGSNVLPRVGRVEGAPHDTGLDTKLVEIDARPRNRVWLKQRKANQTDRPRNGKP